MKEMVRILGIDDGPFDFGDDTVPVAGAIMRGGYVDALMVSKVQVDGEDATERILGMIEGSRYEEQIRVIMMDGVALGGFNVVNLEEVTRATGIPSMSITRNEPDLEAMRNVLEREFEDWGERWRIVSSGRLFTVDTGHNPLHVKTVGIPEDEAREVITRSIMRGALPEPLRIAHLMATALVKGESKGKA